MSNYTTEQRRELTRSKPTLNEGSDKDFLALQLDTSVAAKIKEDSSNNNLFRNINSEVTGLAYEYRYITGTYHPTLDEQEYFYKDKDEFDEVVVESFWDSQKLQDAGGLKPENEFHLNIREGTTIKFPIRPEKYASWSTGYTEPFETTETNMITMVRTLDGWFTSGGGSGLMETTVFGEYYEKILGEEDEKQPYMTVGYAGYQGDPNDGYMTPGFDKTGEIILINGSDLDNFSFGKVVASRDLPSRILFVPYGKVGEIPEDSDVTSTFSIGTQIIKLIAEQVCFMIKDYFTQTIHYLERNPNQDDAFNEPIMTGIETILGYYDTWEKLSNRTDFTEMLQLMTDIETIRPPATLTARQIWIDSYLDGAGSIYDSRFDIIDLRITKNAGTLKEVMTATSGIEIITDIFADRDTTVALHDNYFIVKFALQDGDYYMRIFVPEAGGLTVGQWCYILTNNPKVPELYLQITEIVDGRVEDPLNAIYDEDGNVQMAYEDCKKVFFGTTVFPPSYLITEGFRIVREI